MRTFTSTPNPGQQSMMEMLGFCLEDTDQPGVSLWRFPARPGDLRMDTYLRLDDAATPCAADIAHHLASNAFANGRRAKGAEIMNVLQAA